MIFASPYSITTLPSRNNPNHIQTNSADKGPSWDDPWDDWTPHRPEVASSFRLKDLLSLKSCRGNSSNPASEIVGTAEGIMDDMARTILASLVGTVVGASVGIGLSNALTQNWCTAAQVATGLAAFAVGGLGGLMTGAAISEKLH